MPKFRNVEEAHKVHRRYNIDTEGEGKYNPFDIYNPQKLRLRFLLDNIPEDSYVLEVGCNSGGLSRLIMAERKCYVKGIDISPEMANRAIGKGFNVVCGEAEKLPYPEEEFDCVIATEVLEHIYKPQDVLSEIHRVLGPNGLLVGTVPHPDSYNAKRKPLEKHDWHHTVFTELRLREHLERFFKDVKLENIAWYNDQTESPQWIAFSARK